MARIIYKSRQDAEIKSKSGGIEQEEGTDLEQFRKDLQRKQN